MTKAWLKGIASPAAALRVFYPGEKAPSPDLDPASGPFDIGNGRALQGRAASGAACFQEHGFALLDHELEQEDEAPRPVIEAMIRERLFPGRPVEIARWLATVSRGGLEDPVYTDWVHQDFGLTAGDFVRNLAGIESPAAAATWQARYACDDVAGCVAISFWRTIGMQGPLRHMPLALCDPGTVKIEDVIDAVPAAEGGSYHIGLRYDEAQRWYHYPEMRGDELLTFKLFECRKDDPGPQRLRAVFHAAFDDPDMPPGAELRRSCEQRVALFLLAE